MEEYLRSYQDQLQFVRAEVYQMAPIKVPVPFWDATGGPFERVPVDNWLVLYDENGISGQGPCSERMEKQLLPLIMNKKSYPYEEWYQNLYWAIRNCGYSGETAVELGRLDYVMHDILAKRKKLPLHRFLGADRNWVLVYASGCGTNLSEQEAVEEAESYLKDGYTTIKIKTTGEADKAVKKIKSIRNAIGDQVKLAVDVNQTFGNASEASEFVKRIEEFQIDWIEEPVHSYNMTELKKLSLHTKVPVAMGESLRCYYPMESYVEAGVTHLQPIPSNLSSVKDWMLSRDLAHKNNIRLSSGGYSHMTASFVATGRKEDMVEYLTPIMRPLCDIMCVCPEEKDGRFILPEIPGSCMVPDFERLKKAGRIERVAYYS